ncbi:MAG: sulfatase [Acidobacteriota bacterium]
MIRRTGASVVRGAVAAAAALALSACAGPPPHPDVLIVTVDTLRADHLGAHGYAAAETPTIDSLLRRGVSFSNATTPMPRTTPALASMLTGLPPHLHGSREVNQPVRPARPSPPAGDAPFLSEILRRRGYATLAVSATLAASPRYGLDRGFDRFDVITRPDNGAGRVTERVLRRVAEMPDDRPKLVWVHYMDPHAEYDPPPPWGDVPGREACDELVRLAATDGWSPGLIFSDRDGVASAALETCTALYDGEIAHVDAALGRLLDGLDKHLRMDRAIVVFTADHGENLGEEGLYYEHGPSLHDASLRIPLGISAPGVAAHRVDSDPATLEDVAPTVLSLAGVPEREWRSMEGVDLSVRLRGGEGGEDAGERLVFAEGGSALQVRNVRWLHSGRADHLHCLNAGRFSLCGPPGEEPGLFDHATDPMLTRDVGDEHPEVRRRLLEARARWPPEDARQRCVRSAGFKLVARPLVDGGYSFALHDLERDPAEARDASGEHPRRSVRMRRALVAWMRQLPPREPRRRPEDEVKALRSLGYID